MWRMRRSWWEMWRPLVRRGLHPFLDPRQVVGVLVQHEPQRDLAVLVVLMPYAVATVEGFGWLLICMGVAQCEPERRTTRWLYVGAFLLVLFYREVPWALLLAERLEGA